VFRPLIPIGDGYRIGCASGEARQVAAEPGLSSLTTAQCGRTGWGAVRPWQQRTGHGEECRGNRFPCSRKDQGLHRRLPG